MYFPRTFESTTMIVTWPQIFSDVVCFKAHITVTFSCFYTPCVWCTWGVRFVIEQSKSSRALFKYYDSGFFLATLRLLFLLLDVCSPSFVYSARILEEFHLIRLDLSPTTDSYSPSPFQQRTIFRRTIYSFLLPLLDREVATNFTIAALHHQRILLHGSDAPSRFAV